LKNADKQMFHLTARTSTEDILVGAVRGVNAQGFYLVLYSIAITTLSLLPRVLQW